MRNFNTLLAVAKKDSLDSPIHSNLNIILDYIINNKHDSDFTTYVCNEILKDTNTPFPNMLDSITHMSIGISVILYTSIRSMVCHDYNKEQIFDIINCQIRYVLVTFIKMFDMYSKKYNLNLNLIICDKV